MALSQKNQQRADPQANHYLSVRSVFHVLLLGAARAGSIGYL